MMERIGKEENVDAEGQTVQQDSFNSVFMMADSGARGWLHRFVSLLVCVV